MSLTMFGSSSTSGLPAVSMELSRDLMARMHDSAMCAGQSSSLVVDYSAASTGAATTPFYPYTGKSSPAPGTSCSSGDDESCGSGGSLRVTTAAADYTEALRCRYGDDMLTGTASSAASSERQQAAMTLGRRDAGDGGIDVEVSAEYEDENDDRQRSSAPNTHRKHKAQKQVLLLFC